MASPALAAASSSSPCFDQTHANRAPLCVRCGRRSFDLQKSTCSSCGYPAGCSPHPQVQLECEGHQKEDNRQRDSGRMRYLRHVPRRFKSNFREATEDAVSKKKGAAAGAN